MSMCSCAHEHRYILVTFMAVQEAACKTNHKGGCQQPTCADMLSSSDSCTTGTSAAGKASLRGTNTPWSYPRLLFIAGLKPAALQPSPEPHQTFPSEC